ncbi:MAG: 23S rRNA (uracil(1939)-C(5))-methyltransferase RlmD [Clostridia bacterium]|nr:23S rRNA (uracil(1939)-C(5))-methyltransferase RlmD [Clostridia bacterium]
MNKNEILSGSVTRIGSGGEGIIKEGEYSVFVPFTLPGERVRYQVLKVKGKIAFGKALEIITPAEERIRPKCKVFGKCGGCQLQHIKYKTQLKLKAKTVADCLSKIAFLEPVVSPCERSDLEYGYRNKLQLPIRENSVGYTIGFFVPNSHRVIPIRSCPIQPEWSAKIISGTQKFVRHYGISAYNDETGKGLVKHVVVRDVDGKLIITVVITENDLPFKSELISLLRENFGEFSLYLNINKLGNNVIFGNEFRLIYGKGRYTAKELGIKYEIGPESFMQVNDGVRKRIYQEAIKCAGADEITVVIDAYSGAGLLTAMFAQRCKKAIGVEIVKEAVDCAEHLKAKNGLKNMENICAPCEKVLPEIMERERKESAKCVLILDPPRQGIERNIIEAIKESLPERIVYISCSPQTLSRDLGLLLGTLKIENGVTVKNDGEVRSAYEIELVKPFDLFPQTRHVETVCLLTRK